MDNTVSPVPAPLKPITLAKATALILIAHHEQHLPFFTGIRWGGTEHDIMSIDFASGADLRAWLEFFGAVETTPLLTTDGTAWLIDAAAYLSTHGGWHGVDLTLHARDLVEPAVDGELDALVDRVKDGELDALVDRVKAVTDAAEIVAETIDAADAAGRTSTMDMLAAAPRARAHLLREGIASLDEPAPYLLAAAPTGDAANRETAAALRARHRPVRIVEFTELPDLDAVDEREVENDAAVSRLIGAAR